MTQELSLTKIIETSSAQLIDYLARGQAKSFDEYRYIVGQIESNRRILNTIKDFAKSAANEPY